ncbi:alpha-ketoacid dehydrogenase subunit beta [Sabulicella rubraurantiaca]|uniref:alpha-ketoacid dehydrogenase subunit beta n=1 Tax=Sabulicella rubraurantiaca TaxID=2811429 RepID=UPI002E2A2204|nr:alpha-ketoacid dehydrogenase subunit beta [Sabulicella rubraurantiaca]
MAELRMVQAVNRALAEAMAEDPSVFLLGEDIGAAGGPFGATRGLLDKFGPDRVRDTPISEAGIVGAAVGAALSGLKPVAEIMFMDFITLAMDALVNQAAKARFMFGGQRGVPMVLRTPHGGGLSAGPQHSQCLEAWLCHIPGLKVVCPATPADAHALLRAAIADPDPVVFIENKALYAMKGEVEEAPAPVPIGRARIARPGRDATVVAYGAAVHWATEAAATLEGEGIEAEVLDLRSLQPWDEAAVLESLSRTHRLVIAQEAVEAFGVGAEIAARMAEIGFDELDGPILRVGAPFTPVPFAKELESAYRPDAARIAAAVRRTLE